MLIIEDHASIHHKCFSRSQLMLLRVIELDIAVWIGEMANRFISCTSNWRLGVENWSGLEDYIFILEGLLSLTTPSKKKRFALFFDANQCNCRWTYKLVMKCKYCFFLFHSSYRPQDPGTRSMCKSVMVLFVFVMTFFEDCFDFLGTNSPFIAVTEQSGNSWFNSSRKLTSCRRRALAFSGHRVWCSEEQEIISAIYWEYTRIYTADWRLGKFKIVRMKRRMNVLLNTYYHLVTT